ncbi:unnamed protein product [Linum trigynum]|uniref:Disease resistance protein RGA3 n=1 Tax=Linum trigynum TaxID=586398 RepID=A0AAV2GGM5_9ROSI
MAEAVLFNVAQGILKYLGSKALEEIALQWKIGDDIKKLTDTVSAIKSVLLDAEEKSYSPKSHQLRLWLRELREAAYDAEDLLDDFSTDVLRRQGIVNAGDRISKEVLDFFSSSNQLAYRSRICHGILDLREKLDGICERRNLFQLEERSAADADAKRKGREQTHSDVPEVVVGREADKERIVELLLSCDDHNRVSVVPIVGIGGLGKTTLAQLAYNDERVDSHFEVKVWVCISENFDVKLIVRKIIECCTDYKPDADLEMETLKKLLREGIEGNKYLIVLDDVWNENREKWSRLMSLLMCGAKGSRVVLTTRLLKVAKLDARMRPYELKGLSEGEGWGLFREIAFRGGEATSAKHEAIGREILEKCKGVPLAIKTIAGALSFRESESEWAMVRSKGMWGVEQNEDDIMPTLKLSYDNLPTHLKHCFAYCSLFPKDHKIDVKRLIQLWIAQGYVHSSDLLTRFDVGINYVNELLWRSFYQEVEKDDRGNVRYCKMHDLMHDLAVEAAGQGSFTFDMSSNPPDSHAQENNVKPERVRRHVSLDFERVFASRHSWRVPTSAADSEKWRTLICVNRSWSMPDVMLGEGCDETILSNMTNLRVVDFSNLSIFQLPRSIRNLKHLKYLDLSHNSMDVLPEEVTELVNLEVLQLYDCRKLERLPNDTGKLSSLAHLGLKGCPRLECMPLGIGRLYHLRELSLFVVAEGGGGAGIEELRRLNNIRGKLLIKNLELVKNPSEAAEAASLLDKQNLEHLELSWGTWRDGEGDVNGEGTLLEALRPPRGLKVFDLSINAGSKCPIWLPTLINLEKIKIKRCRNWKSLPPVDQLPFLATLEVSECESLEYIETSSSRSPFFPCLKSLMLVDCPKLKGWSTKPGELLPQFPCVSHIKIKECYNITYIPCSSLHLESLTLFDGSKELLNQILRVPPSHSSAPLQSCFKHLLLQHVDLDCMGEEILPRLSSLQTLTILRCSELKTLSPALPNYFTSLQRLHIERCSKLDLCDNSNDTLMLQQQQQVALHNLTEIRLKSILAMASLPDWLQMAPNLRELRMKYCQVTCFPDWMPKLTELESLIIRQYGKSAHKCFVEDWPNIGHIPDVDINYSCMQENGICRMKETSEREEQEEKEEEEVPYGNEENEQVTKEEDEETSKLVQFFRNCATSCNIFGRCFQ